MRHVSTSKASSIRNIDVVRTIQSQLSAELSEAVRILGESGCNSFLDVARVLVLAGQI